MKKLLVLLMMLMMVGVNLFADNHQQQIELTYDKRPPKIDKPKDRSLQLGMEASLDFPNLVFCSYMVEEQGAGVYIINDNGEVVMSNTLWFTPFCQTTLYVGDLPSGTYQLVIELEDYVLYGTFLIL